MQLRAPQIVPLLALITLVAVAALWSGAVRAGGEAQVFQGTQAYLRALEEGRFDDAAAFHAQAEADARLVRILEAQAARLEGVTFVVTGVVHGPDGGLEARVAAVDPRGGGEIRDALKLRWAETSAGRWVVR